MRRIMFLDFPEVLWAFLNQELPATLLGVGVGIPIALYLDRRISARRAKKERTDLLVLLKENLGSNLSLLGQLKKEMTEELLPLYPLDLTIWQTHSARITCIENVRLIQSINKAYYELEHMNRKTNAYFGAAFGPLVTEGLKKRMELLKGAILDHVDNLIPIVKGTIEDINEALHISY
jgi:hypothetical protein